MIKVIIPAPLLLKATSAGTVDNAGIDRQLMFHMVNTNMWHHPKYYKELRKLRNKLDQAISDEASTEATSVRPGPGQIKKATSRKLQASSNKHNQQATSSKQQANEG